MTLTLSFDEATFRQLVAELGAADTAVMLELFLTDTADKLARLDTDGPIASVIRREAHSIKSSAATFGFKELSRMAQELEAGAEAMPPPALQESVRALRPAFETTREFAKSQLLNAGAGAET